MSEFITVLIPNQAPMDVPKANKANVEADLIKRGVKGFRIEDPAEKARIRLQNEKLKQQFADSQTVQIKTDAEPIGSSHQSGEKSGTEPGNTQGVLTTRTTSDKRPGRASSSSKRKAADSGAGKK